MLAQAEAPAQYPSERLIQSTSEENQIPSHLPVCPSLQHIASLQGSAVIDLFHSSIAEVLAQALLLLPDTCVGRVVGSAVLPVSLRVEQGLCEDILRSQISLTSCGHLHLLAALRIWSNGLPLTSQPGVPCHI